MKKEIKKKVVVELSYCYFADDERVKLLIEFLYDSGSGLHGVYDMNMQDIILAQNVYNKTKGKLDKYLYSTNRNSQSEVFMHENDYLGLYDDITKKEVRTLISKVLCYLSKLIDEPLLLKSEFDEEYYLVPKTQTEEQLEQVTKEVSDYLKSEYVKSDYFEKSEEKRYIYELQKKLDLQQLKKLYRSLNECEYV